MPTAPTKRRKSVLTPAAGRPAAPPCIRTQFYLEELLKHWQHIEDQRECYSACTIEHVERALHRIMAEIEHLSARENADQMVSGLLRKFDVLTGLSHWTDPKTLH